MQDVGLLSILVVAGAALAATITDVWKFKVYNALTVPLFLSGLAYHGLTGGGTALGSSLAGAAIGFFPLLLFHLLGGMGAGDVKLAGGVGAWLGATAMSGVLVASCLATGVCAVVLMLWSGNIVGVWLKFRMLVYRMLTGDLVGEDQVAPTLARADRRRHAVPFGAMLAIGMFAQLAGLDRVIHF